uniref:Uncharacterized protein n=1 Tax=Anguilla anguilla TaxID=7936 RepID=A0A0E9VWN7_ANGAN
MLRSKSPIH